MTSPGTPTGTSGVSGVVGLSGSPGVSGGTLPSTIATFVTVPVAFSVTFTLKLTVTPSPPFRLPKSSVAKVCPFTCSSDKPFVLPSGIVTFKLPA